MRVSEDFMKTTRRNFLRTTAGLASWTAALAAGASFAAAPKTSKNRPNFLILVANHEREMDVDRKALGMTNRARLEAHSVRFLHNYCVTPQSAPAQSALLTGLYPHQTGVTTDTDASELGRPLPPATPCIGKVFENAGYRTGYFGAWRLGSAEGGLDSYGFPGYAPGGDNSLAGHAKEFFDHEDERPWMLWISFSNPTGVQPNEPYLRYYTASLRAIDEQLGQILRALDESKRREEVIVIYTSERGVMDGAHNASASGLSPYEEVLNIPLVISWPGRLPEGETRTALVSQIDLVPTLCAMAGVRWPARLPGQNLLPLIRDPRQRGRDYVYAEYLYHNGAAAPYRLVRTEDIKLCEYLGGETILFDMLNDPHEFRNMSGESEFRDVQRALHERLLEWRKATGDPYLDPGKLKRLLAPRPR
jgi:arylsulfatase A-like enzyme